MTRSKVELRHWAAIRESPQDDAPRLSYADWLESRGNEARAHLIRVQCSLALLGGDRRKGKKERAWLEPREKQLLTRHGELWLTQFRKTMKGSNPWDMADDWLNRMVFRRGFVSGQNLGLETARRLAAAGDRLEPVDQVYVTECGAHYCHESVIQIAQWTGAGCVLGLSVAWGSDRDIAVIVRSPSLDNLQHLGVWHGNVTDRGLKSLADWPAAISLKSIDLKDNAITDAGAFALADSPYLGPLRRLDLYRTRIGPMGRQRLRDRFGDAVAMD